MKPLSIIVCLALICCARAHLADGEGNRKLMQQVITPVTPGPGVAITPLQYNGTVQSPFFSKFCNGHIFRLGEQGNCPISPKGAANTSCFHVPACCEASAADGDVFCYPQYYENKQNTYTGQNFTCPGDSTADPPYPSGYKTPTAACCQEIYEFGSAPPLRECT